MYLPGHKCVLEKFNVMVTLHLVQSAFLLSLLPNKLTEHAGQDLNGSFSVLLKTLDAL